MLTCGVGAYISWFAALREQTWQGTPMNISILGALTRALARSDVFVPLMDRPDLVIPLWLLGSAALGGVLWRRMRRLDDVDRDFAALLVTMLLVSPAGWAYYLPLAAGPVAAVAAARPGRAWIAAAGCFLTPFWLLSAGPSAAWITITLASAYTWGAFIILWLTLRLQRPTPQPLTARSSPHSRMNAGLTSTLMMSE